jgi:hypothetical protein
VNFDPKVCSSYRADPRENGPQVSPVHSVRSRPAREAIQASADILYLINSLRFDSIAKFELEFIDSYCTAVVRCVTHASEESLPVRQVSCVNDFGVPGWIELVQG